MRTPRRRLLIGFVLIAIVGVALLSVATGMTPLVRDRVVSALNARFESDVQLDSLQVGVFPRPELSGSGATVRWEGRTDVPPLIQIGEFGASAGLFGLLGTPVRLRNVQLDRLEIHIPPGGIKDIKSSMSAGTSGSQPPTSDGDGSRLKIDEIVAHAAQL